MIEPSVSLAWQGYEYEADMDMDIGNIHLKAANLPKRSVESHDGSPRSCATIR